MEEEILKLMKESETEHHYNNALATAHIKIAKAERGKRKEADNETNDDNWFAAIKGELAAAAVADLLESDGNMGAESIKDICEEEMECYKAAQQLRHQCKKGKVAILSNAVL